MNLLAAFGSISCITYVVVAGCATQQRDHQKFWVSELHALTVNVKGGL